MPDLTDAPTLTHGSTVLASGVRLHHVTAGAGPRTIVLLHGYPQTWWSWRHVIGPLSDAGFRVVAPDYRGAGHSSKPPHGYDKRTMAGDIASLLTDGLGVERRVTLVGNDIGMMVAYAFGSEYPDRVERLVLMEAVLPGTAAYDRLVATPTLVGAPMWHFFFHNAGDGLPEALTAGRERLYLRHFYDRHAFDPEAIGPADLDRYTDAFATSGAMRAGFEIYRAFDQDAADNRAALAARAGCGYRCSPSAVPPASFPRSLPKWLAKSPRMSPSLASLAAATGSRKRTRRRWWSTFSASPARPGRKRRERCSLM